MLSQTAPQTPPWFLNFLTHVIQFMLGDSIPEVHVKLKGGFSKKSLVGAVQIWNNQCLTLYSQHGSTADMRAIYTDPVTRQHVERKPWDILSCIFARISNSSLPDKPVVELKIPDPSYMTRLDSGVPSTHYKPTLPIHAWGDDPHMHFWVEADSNNAFKAWQHLLGNVLTTPTEFLTVSPDGKIVALKGVEAILTKTDAQRVIAALNATYTENDLHRILPEADARISWVTNEALQTFWNNIASAVIGQIVSRGVMYGLSHCQDRIAQRFNHAIVTYIGLFIKLLFFAIFASSDIFVELLAYGAFLIVSLGLSSIFTEIKEYSPALVHGLETLLFYLIYFMLFIVKTDDRDQLGAILGNQLANLTAASAVTAAQGLFHFCFSGKPPAQKTD